jgi:hypothetical protein
LFRTRTAGRTQGLYIPEARGLSALRLDGVHRFWDRIAAPRARSSHCGIAGRGGRFIDLKVDRSLVQEMQTDRATCDIVELIAALARKMNLRAIAEGIETARQLERLLELGCEYGQGYYFSQPMEAKAAQQFMREQVAPARTRGAGK